MKRKLIAGLLLITLLFTQEIPVITGERPYQVYASESEEMTGAADEQTEENTDRTQEAVPITEQAPELAELNAIEKILAPREPTSEIASDSQKGPDTGVEVVKNTANTLFGEFADTIEEVLSDEAKDLLSESTRLAEKGNRKLKTAPMVSPKKAERLIKKGDNCLNRSQDLAEQASKYTIASNVLKWGGIAMNGYNIYSNTKEMQNLQNEHTSLRTAEAALLYTDSALAVISIAAALTTTVTPPGLALQLGVGIAATIMHSEQFAEWANQWDNGFLDAADDFFETLFPWMKTPDGVNCYKPNIYLYSNTGRQVRIRFQYPQLVTASIPDYGSGWNVWINEDGSLEEGSAEKSWDEADYLFYESITSVSLFQTLEGYRIPARLREETFTVVLTAMGFNEQEISDFNDFWCEKLETGVDYIMYPQDTETVELAMPMEIDPMPETVERIWFAFSADEGQDVEMPKPYILERGDEYALVEWGGMILP